MSSVERSLLHSHTLHTVRSSAGSSDEGSSNEAATDTEEQLTQRRNAHDTAMHSMQRDTTGASSASVAATSTVATAVQAFPFANTAVPLRPAARSPTAHSNPLAFTPFLQLPGVRPLLCLLLLYVFLSHTPRGLLAAENPWREVSGCAVVGSFVFLNGIAALCSLCAIIAYPIIFSAAHMQRTAHKVWPILRTVFDALFDWLPLIGVVASVVTLIATLGSTRSCWHDQPLREWAVMDAMAIIAMTTFAAIYSFLRHPPVAKILLLSAGISPGTPASPLLSSRPASRSQRERLHRLLIGCAGVFAAVRTNLFIYGRVWLCVVAVMLIGAQEMHRDSYHQVMMNIPHFTLVERPAACMSSCNVQSTYGDRLRSRRCVAGDMQQMPVHECISQQPSTQLSRHHQVFDECLKPSCMFPKSSPRYYWVHRHEHLIGSSGRSSSLLTGFGSLSAHHHRRCSLHDTRQFERVAYSSEWQCFDNVKHLFHDHWYCDGTPPPFSRTGKFNVHDAWRTITVPTAHCTNPCEPLQGLIEQWTAWWTIVLAFCVITWILRWIAGVPLLSARWPHAAVRDSASAASGSSKLSPPRPRAGSSPSPSPSATALASTVLSSHCCSPLLALFGLSSPSSSAEPVWLHEARSHLARRVYAPHRWMITRIAIYVQFILTYGLRILPRSVEFTVRWAALIALVYLQYSATEWVVWLVDSPCTFFTALLFTHVAIIYAAGMAVMLSALFHAQHPADFVPVAVHEQQA